MGKYDSYYLFDLPVPYKDLLIYPVRIRDYNIFMYLSQCLMLEKNSIKNSVLAMKAIQMTYLEYMFFVSNDEFNFIQLFFGLFAIVLQKRDDKDFEINLSRDEAGRPLFEIEGKIYNSQDFDEIKDIIAEQNDLSLPDERIQKDVREKMEEARKFKERLNKSKIASFEELIVSLSLYTGWDFDKVYDMTIRKFMMALQRANHMIMSNIYLTASMSGMASFKDKSVLRGWLADLEVTDKNADVKMSLESVQDKVSGEEAKRK